MTPASLYGMAMGEAFHRLGPAVRRFHSLTGQHEFHGRVEVHAPSSFLASLLALCLGTPLRAAEGPIRFALRAEPGSETWTRFFPSQATMRSTFSAEGRYVTERLGPSRLRFALLEADGALEMRLEKLHFLGLPCPGWLRPRITARETGDAEKLFFQVEASVPCIGRVASYNGYLGIPGIPGECAA